MEGGRSVAYVTARVFVPLSLSLSASCVSSSLVFIITVLFIVYLSFLLFIMTNYIVHVSIDPVHWLIL